MDRCTSEPEIIAGCVRKSKEHQERLYKQYFGYVMAVCLTYTPDRSTALEITNDSFLKVFGSLDRYDPAQPFKAWLRRIAVNTAIDHYRKNIKHTAHMDISDSISHSVSFDVIDQLTVEDIYALINRLPDVQKMVFNLYEIEGYDHRDISRFLGIPVSSSRTYLTRAKQKLRELIKIHFK